MKRRRHDLFHSAHGSMPNLAPMVDVVMVILIFFMLGTSFAVSEGALQTQLPADVGPGGGASVSIIPIVRIGLAEVEGNLKITVLNQPLADPSANGLFGYMKGRREAGADPEGRVVIGSASNVRYKHVIAAYNACVRAGFKNVQFAVSGEKR